MIISELHYVILITFCLQLRNGCKLFVLLSFLCKKMNFNVNNFVINDFFIKDQDQEHRMTKK